MPKFSQVMLPGLGVTGLVLTGAFAFATAGRDRAEFEASEAALSAVRAELSAAEARISEMNMAAATAAQLQEAEDRIAALEAELAARPEVAVEAAPAPAAEPEAPVVLSGNIDKGETLFRECRACHKVGAGATNGVGPHLNLLFGRNAASVPEYRYSDSLKRAAANGLEWHADTLSQYIADPRTFASGTRMSYAGMKDAQDRADLLAYLRTFSDDPSNIPEADPTAQGTDHEIDPEILALTGDAEYGEYLSSECTTCHQASGGDDGIPSIVLWPEESFVMAMHAYKDQVRPNQVMQMIAGRLSNDEIAALAAYFANLEQ